MSDLFKPLPLTSPRAAGEETYEYRMTSYPQMVTGIPGYAGILRLDDPHPRPCLFCRYFQVRNGRESCNADIPRWIVVFDKLPGSMRPGMVCEHRKKETRKQARHRRRYGCPTL